MTNSIGWCDETANWQAGCSYASPGCFHCWALAMTRRMARNPKAPERYRRPGEETWLLDEDDEGWSGNIAWDPYAFGAAILRMERAKKPLRWFLGSMTDLFHANAPEVALAMLAGGLMSSKLTHHTLILSTKRPARLLEWQQRYFPGGLPSNVWCLLSVANQEDLDRKMSDFLALRSEVCGLQVEPMLERIDLHEYDWRMTGRWWAIIGPENGPHARPYDPAWGRDLAQQCADAGIPVWGKAGSGIERQEVAHE